MNAKEKQYLMIVIALAILIGIILAVKFLPTAQAPANENEIGGTGEVKKFNTDSFFVMENGKPHPQFSLKEITVKKGDKVKINVNAINGTHNFNLDEFNIHSETPTGKVTAVEFTADKVGEFIYYCSMPGHRANGHWGTLKVVE